MDPTKTFSLYGLEILGCMNLVSSDDSADVIWTNSSFPSVPDDGAGAVREIVSNAESWTRHVFAAGGTTFAEFDVSSDGRSVRSWAAPEVDSKDLEQLFLETVMRTVLCRLGHPAVHAAALQKHGKSVLLVGDKGAGKSTLAAGLQRSGWQLIADDLVRLRRDDAEWCALPGLQRNKLLVDSVKALGHFPEVEERRWKGNIPVGVEPASVAKFLLQPNQQIESSAAFPIAAILCLSGRQQTSEPSMANLPPREGAFLLSQHLIRDPLPPCAPPASAGTMVGDLASKAAIWRIGLPDDLQQLQKSAAWLDNFLQNNVLASHARS